MCVCVCVCVCVCLGMKEGTDVMKEKEFVPFLCFLNYDDNEGGDCGVEKGIGGGQSEMRRMGEQNEVPQKQPGRGFGADVVTSKGQQARESKPCEVRRGKDELRAKLDLHCYGVGSVAYRCTCRLAGGEESRFSERITIHRVQTAEDRFSLGLWVQSAYSR